MDAVDMKKKTCPTVIKHFSCIEDPRIDRNKKHKLSEIIVVSLCSILCGINTIDGIAEFGKNKLHWLKEFLDLENGIPSHDTIGRVFSLIDPDVFQECFIAWIDEIRVKKNGEVIAIDGKTIKRSYDKKTSKAAIHIVSAWATESGISLGQLKTDEKSNEITAIPDLLKTLFIDDSIITIDAMGCQKNISELIISNEANYTLALKGNQKSLFSDVKTLFQAYKSSNTDLPFIEHLVSKEINRGRKEERNFYLISNIDEIQKKHDWPGLQSIGMVVSKRNINGKTTEAIRYYINSYPDNIKKFSHAVRSHWSIENNLHWVLDVTFSEDASRIRIGHGPENFSTMKKIAINLLKKNTEKKSIPMKQIRCSFDETYLMKTLFG